MPVITDEGEAMQLLSALTDATVEPILNPAPDLQDLLDAARVARIWEASTSYDYGAVVQPTAAKRNGRRFRLVRFDGVGTSSGATEPTWTTSLEGTVSDGNLTWQEDGRDFDCLWDLHLAAHKGWLLKAGRVASCTDFKEHGLGFSSSQMYAHCIEQANKYYPVLVA